ncbi:hypothetical protein XF14_26500 [Burkholderia gladioli]|nr:hypothetical protein XF14_26500 [Burkholderia gladioli]
MATRGLPERCWVILLPPVRCTRGHAPPRRKRADERLRGNRARRGGRAATVRICMGSRGGPALHAGSAGCKGKRPRCGNGNPAHASAQARHARGRKQESRR